MNKAECIFNKIAGLEEYFLKAYPSLSQGGKQQKLIRGLAESFHIPMKNKTVLKNKINRNIVNQLLVDEAEYARRLPIFDETGSMMTKIRNNVNSAKQNLNELQYM